MFVKERGQFTRGTSLRCSVPLQRRSGGFFMHCLGFVGEGGSDPLVMQTPFQLKHFALNSHFLWTRFWSGSSIRALFGDGAYYLISRIRSTGNSDVSDRKST